MKRFLVVALASLIASPASAEVQMQPGQWRGQVKVTSFDMEDAPPGIAELVTQSKAIDRCVTTEEAASGPTQMLKGDPQCKTSRQSMSGGRFEAVIVCNQFGSTTTATVTGNISATRFDMNAVVEIAGPMSMKLTTVTTAERVGECR